MDDGLAWLASHRIATLVIVGFVAVGLLLSAARGLQVDPRNLSVGDCLYVRTSAAPLDRPIGDERQVALALLAGGSERAGCTASHGHEVSAIVVPGPMPTAKPGDVPTLLDATAMRRLTAPLCDAAFAGYVGRPLGGSRFTTFPVVPDADGAEAWLNGGTRTVCLVARSDGHWMDHPARGSRE